jgi:predicted MFS family arabinose efflux permease
MRVSAGTGAGWIVAGAVIGAALYRAVTLADTWWIMALGVLIPLAAVWLAQRATATVAD